MLTLEKRIQQWKKWVNRNKQFSTEELEELENHLREEILYLTEHDKIPNQKAFDQALDILGEKGLLDEEFGKIRKSKFDKVKLWAYAQTFVIVGLIIVLVLPYIHLPRKDFANSLIGEEIGYITDWIDEIPTMEIEHVVSRQNQFYLAFNENIFCYGSDKENPRTNYFFGTYFSKSPTCLQQYTFDVDVDFNMYCLERSNGNYIRIYNESQPTKSILLSDMDESNNVDDVVGLQVVDKHLFVFVTKQKIVSGDDPNSKYKVSVTGGDSGLVISGSTNWSYVDSLISSYVFVCDLTKTPKQFDKIPLKNIIVAVDRSEDELALLSNAGLIETFTWQNKELKLQKSWQIEDYTSHFTPVTIGNFIYVKRFNKMIVKNYSNEYFYLYPTKANVRKMISLKNLNINGIVKKTIGSSERLVMIRKKTSNYNFHNLYLFKD